MTLGSYWDAFPYSIVISLLIALMIVLLNYFTVHRLGDFPLAQAFPHVSVLIPARNEEANIRACVESLLAQDYPDFEVLVLDDASTDQTPAILEHLSRGEPRLRVFRGEPLPAGWLGKHWANQQLSQKASGDLFLFTDADTRHAPNTLRDSVSALIARRVDLLTAFPREEMLTWGERLTVPILSFSIFAFFPIWIAEKLRWPALSVTIGQYMLFRRAAFDAIGGYGAVRDNLVDDVVLGRNIVTHGFRWQLVDGTHHISCRMYRDFSSAVEGFTKNLVAFFDYHLLLYIIGWFWIAVSFLLPPIVLIFPGINSLLNFPAHLSFIAVIEALLIFVLAYHRFRFPAYLVAFYPLSIFMFAVLAIRSLIYTVSGKGSWKDRKLPPPTIRL